MSIFRAEFDNWLRNIIKTYNLSGDIIEIGGFFDYPLYFKNTKTLLSLNLSYSNRISKKINQIVCDFVNANFLKDNFFDCVMAIYVLEHINPATQREFIQQMVRIVKPMGHIIIAAPEKCRYHPNPIDGLRYTLDDLIRLFSPCELITHTKSKHVWEVTNKEEIHHFCLFRKRKWN